jgi:hypothetical protein
MTAPSVVSIDFERDRQASRWEYRDIAADGVGTKTQVGEAMYHQRTDELARERGDRTWADALVAQTYQVVAQSEKGDLRTALVRLGALVAIWIDDIDARGPGGVR